MVIDLTLQNPDGQAAVGGFVVADVPASAHTYFDGLRARPDCFAAYSLRDAAQVHAYRVPTNGVSLQYVFLTDPDPRKQDGMRVRIPEGAKGADSQVRVPAGPSHGAHVLVTLDLWYGSEWRHDHSRLQLHKETPFSVDRGGGVRWAGMRTDYANAARHPSNQPTGGPYVSFIYGQPPKGFTKTSAGWYMDTQTGFPRLNLPYTAPAGETRNYNEGMAPVDTSQGPVGAETGVVAERWHRIWHYFERVPAEDFESPAGVLLNAYKWSYWMADTVREPIRMLHEAIIGLPASVGAQIAAVTVANHGAGESNEPATWIGRGDLIAYFRNVVVLHGTSKASVVALLQKPVA